MHFFDLASERSRFIPTVHILNLGLSLFWKERTACTWLVATAAKPVVQSHCDHDYLPSCLNISLIILLRYFNGGTNTTTIRSVKHSNGKQRRLIMEGLGNNSDMDYSTFKMSQPISWNKSTFIRFWHKLSSTRWFNCPIRTSQSGRTFERMRQHWRWRFD